jgi:hypothetical protein
MRKIGKMGGIIIGALMLAVTSVGVVQAAPTEQACAYDAFRQSDMAGTFVSSEYQIRLEIYPCGGSFMKWENQYGEHVAVYFGTNRLPGGGIVASKMPNTLESLNGTDRIGFKPAEPGYIQVIPMDDYGNIRGVYRLKKIS